MKKDNKMFYHIKRYLLYVQPAMEELRTQSRLQFFAAAATNTVTEILRYITWC